MKTKIQLIILFITNLYSNEVDVINASVSCNTQNICNFTATLKHRDTSWKHYANKFDIIVNKKVIATRVLLHPHINEQPFTRGLSGVKIPKDTKKIVIRAHDLVHKYGGKEFTLILHK
jgi:hypothetical protein